MDTPIYLVVYLGIAAIIGLLVYGISKYKRRRPTVKGKPKRRRH